MENNKKNNELECLKEEIRLFRKNENAVGDIISLYQILSSNIPIYNLIEITLVEKIIQNLGDPEITIPYKVDSVFQFLILLHSQYHNIINKYQSYQEECKVYLQDFMNSYKYKEKIMERDLNRILILNKNFTFNLIQELLSTSPQLIYKFLVSELPMNTRLEMFIDVLTAKQDENYYLFFSHEKRNYLSKEENKKLPKKMKELLNKANNINNQKQYMESLLSSSERTIISLQNYGLNMNNYYWKYKLPDKARPNNIRLSSVSYIFNMKERPQFFKSLYEDKSYLAIDEKVRTNNDLFILSSLHLVYIPIFIKFSHFVITEEKIELLTTRIVKELEQIDTAELELRKESYKKIFKEIAKAIISKAKNKQEYKKFCIYAKSFIETVDIEKKILPLNEKRRELSTLLYRMNDYAQENIPGKRLIKEIKSFKSRTYRQ